MLEVLIWTGCIFTDIVNLNRDMRTVRRGRSLDLEGLHIYIYPESFWEEIEVLLVWIQKAYIFSENFYLFSSMRRVISVRILDMARIHFPQYCEPY